MTPDEQILAETQKALAAGGDPFGDNDAAESTPATDPANTQTAQDNADASDSTEGNTADPGKDEKPDAGTGEQQPDASILEEIAQQKPVQQPEPPQYQAEVLGNADEKIAALFADKAAAMKQLMAGEIEAEDYAQVDMRVTAEMNKLVASTAKAETLQEINTQSLRNQQDAILIDLVTRTAAEVPYATDQTAVSQFNIALSGLQVMPENANTHFAVLCEKAHRAVMAMRGVDQVPKAEAKAAEQAQAAIAEARKPKGDIPVTLRGIPAAANPNTGGGILEQIGRLKGQEFETAFAKLTPSQRAELLND
jgi:hypothetical protein